MVIVGSNFSVIERRFEVFHVYLFCHYTATLFLIFNKKNHRLCPRPNTLNVKKATFSFTLVFRNLACKLLLMCLYYYSYKYLRLDFICFCTIKK